MFERFNTPEELFSFKLGSTLTMEQKLVGVLEDLEASAKRPDIKRALDVARSAMRTIAQQGIAVGATG